MIYKNMLKSDTYLNHCKLTLLESELIVVLEVINTERAMQNVIMSVLERSYINAFGYICSNI